MTIMILNYAHSFSAAQLATLTSMLGEQPTIRPVSSQADRMRPLADVARELADAAGLSPEEWETTALVLNPPSLAPLALALVAEIHGRSGGFIAMLNIRPVPDSTPTRYEIAEIINLQRIREAARTLREH